MKLIRLTPEYEFNDFDYGDDDLNEFLYEDAKSFHCISRSAYWHRIDCND